MIKITKDGKTSSVPAGSVAKFLSAGWVLLNGEAPSKKKAEPTISPEESTEAPTEELIEEEQGEDEEDTEEVEYVDPEELMQKPLSELDKEELIILAQYKGIDTENLTTSKQLRAAIRNLD